MEIIGLIVLLVLGSIVVYYLDFHTTIWGALKERYASYKQDLDNYYSFDNIRDRATKKRDRAAKKRTEDFKKVTEKHRKTLDAWRKIQDLERDRREAKKKEESYKPSSLSEDYFFQNSAKDQFVCSPRTRLEPDLGTVKLDLQRKKLNLEKEYEMKLKKEISLLSESKSGPE